MKGDPLYFSAFGPFWSLAAVNSAEEMAIVRDGVKSIGNGLSTLHWIGGTTNLTDSRELSFINYIPDYTGNLAYFTGI